MSSNTNVSPDTVPATGTPWTTSPGMSVVIDTVPLFELPGLPVPWAGGVTVSSSGVLGSTVPDAGLTLQPGVTVAVKSYGTTPGVSSIVNDCPGACALHVSV